MRHHLVINAVAGIAALGASAPALSAPGDANVRCFLVSNIFAKAAKDAKGQQVAAFVRFYNLGQMQAKLSPAQIKAQIVTVGKTLTDKSAAEAMNACARNLEAADKSIETIGQQLRQGGK
jgi:hypothetical protein